MARGPRIVRFGLPGLFLAGVAHWAVAGEPAPLPGAGAPPAEPLHAVRIHVPPEVGQAHTAETDALGRPGRVTCVSCHAEREEPLAAPAAAAIDSVHTGMKFTHGELSCFSCHDRESDYDRLRLADGGVIPYVEVVTLCSQCHGPQRKDFDHGAHGGMTGYWDLERGPRDRNSCVVCHDAHAPAFPSMRPTFKPIDRFLSPAAHAEGSDGR